MTNLKSKTSKMCLECRNKERRKNIPTKEELEKVIYTMPFTKIAKIYGVSDKMVSKWCKGYNLPYRKNDMKGKV